MWGKWKNGGCEVICWWLGLWMYCVRGDGGFFWGWCGYKKVVFGEECGEVIESGSLIRWFWWFLWFCGGGEWLS